MKCSHLFFSFFAACGGIDPLPALPETNEDPLPPEPEMSDAPAMVRPPIPLACSERKHALGSDGPLGTRIVLPPVLLGPPVSGDRPIGLVRWRDPDSIPRQVGIHIQPLIVNSGTAVRHRARADLRWGHEGALFGQNQRVSIDLVRGVTLNLFASYVEIEAANESEGAVGPDVALSSIPIVATLNPECYYGETAHLTRSFTRDNTLAPGFIVEIPPFANTLDVLHAGASAAYRIDFRQDTGVVIASWNVLATESAPPRPIPVPNDAFDVMIDSGFVNLGLTEAIFNLEL